MKFQLSPANMGTLAGFSRMCVVAIDRAFKEHKANLPENAHFATDAAAILRKLENRLHLVALVGIFDQPVELSQQELKAFFGCADFITSHKMHWLDGGLAENLSELLDELQPQLPTEW